MRPLRQAALVLAVIVLAAGSSLAATTSRWTSLGPFGGSVESLTVDPRDARVVYASLGAQGGFKSTDGGASWTLIHESAESIAVDPSQTGTVYLASATWVFKSSDGGRHWTTLESLGYSAIHAIAVDPVIPSRVYAGTWYDGVLRSTDRGASWSPARIPLPGGDASRVRALVPARPHGRVFALTDGGLFRSTNGGQSWASAGNGLPAGAPLALAMDPADPGTVYVSLGDGLFRSVDGGASWARTPGQPAGSGTVLSLAVSAQGVWAGTETGLFRSADGGATWSAAGPPRRITAMAIALSSPRTVYLGTTADSGFLGGVFASTDGGATWARRNQGLAGLAVTDLEAIQGIPGWLWITTGESVYQSRDGGQSWTRASLKLPPSDSFGLASSPADALLLYAYSWPRLWRTLDGGVTWSEVLRSPSSPTPWYGYLLADPGDPWTLWSSRGDVSRDGGATWRAVGGLPAVRYCSLGHLALAPSLPSTLYMSGSRDAIPPGYGVPCRHQSAVFLRSTDSGATWALSYGPGPGPIAVDPRDSRLIYVGGAVPSFTFQGPPGLWKSTDGGDTWLAMDESIWSLGPVSALVIPRQGVVWAAQDYYLGLRVFRSGDAGESWQDVRKNLKVQAVYELVADPADPRRIYAATSNGVWVATETD